VLPYGNHGSQFPPVGAEMGETIDTRRPGRQFGSQENRQTHGKLPHAKRLVHRSIFRTPGKGMAYRDVTTIE
jgi:hypothetical protein